MLPQYWVKKNTLHSHWLYTKKDFPWEKDSAQRWSENKKSWVSMAISTYPKGTNLLCRTFEISSKKIYNRDSLLWISTLNISAPFDWKSTKFRIVVVITPRSKKSIWVMTKIPATSELEAEESGIFGFSWFCPCSLSQNWWGAQTWTIKYHIDFCHRTVTKKKFMKFWRGTAEICGSEDGQIDCFESHISQLSHVRISWFFFLVTLLWQKSTWYFMVNVWASHQFWENKHKQNHENKKMQKMPLSLASSSDVARILAMTHKDTIDL